MDIGSTAVILVKSNTAPSLKDVDQLALTAGLLKTYFGDLSIDLSLEEKLAIQNTKAVIQVLAAPVMSKDLVEQIISKDPKVWLISDTGSSYDMLHKGSNPQDEESRSFPPIS